jgi:flagellar biogenesis protein FliO
VPTGPILVLTLFLIFLITWCVRKLQSRNRQKAVARQETIGD